jgi:CheY-like chemotaxis protein
MHGSLDDTGRTWIEVRINDTGIGFDPMRVDLFQPFTQADGSTTRRFGGSGLGLSICRGLVERMGGKIGADSGPGLGATFWFKIPVDDAKPRESYVRTLKGARIVLATQEPGAFVGIIAGLSDLGVATKLADPIALMAGTIKIDDGPYLALLTDVANLGAIDIGADARILLTSESIDGFVPRRTAFRQGFGDILALPPKLDDVVGALGALAREEPPVIAALSVVPDQTISDLKSLFAGRQVLVLEDNPMSRAVVARQFQALGVAVTLVENGRLGLEAVESHDFAMVFTDCAMPEIDGYLFTQILRRRELGTGRHLPIIAMTANAADDDAKKCLAAGMDDYLAKPVRLSVLARVLGAWARGDGATGHGPGQTAADVGPVDLTLLAEILGDSSAEALDEALDMFGEFFPGFLDDARAACAQSDREAMIDAAHTAKGASRNAGALALGHALGQAEDHAKLGDFAAYEADLDRAAQEWTKVRAFIAERGTIAGAATGSSVHA